MLHLKVLACKSLFRELSFYAALSNNVVDISYFEWGLHNKVGALSTVLQSEIDAVDAGGDIHTSYPPYDQDFDGILIGYGLCSNGVVGLSSSRYPLVIPRAHDCITLLLGSQERYDAEFAKEGGTYWLSPGWIESSRIPGARDKEWLYNKFCEKYDEEQARMMADMNDEWMSNYARLALIEWPEFNERAFSQKAKEIGVQSAASVNMTFEALQGDSALIQDFLEGNWDEERFLVVPPHKKVKASYDKGVITY